MAAESEPALIAKGQTCAFNNRVCAVCLSVATCSLPGASWHILPQRTQKMPFSCIFDLVFKVLCALLFDFICSWITTTLKLLESLSKLIGVVRSSCVIREFLLLRMILIIIVHYNLWWRFFQLYTVSLLCDHQILTKDAVTVSVEAVIYYRISDASAVVNQLENHRFVKPIRGKTLNTQPQLSQLFFKKYICTKGHSNHIFMYLLHSTTETGSLYSCWTEDLFYTQLVTNFSLAPECPLDTHLH